MGIHKCEPGDLFYESLNESSNNLFKHTKSHLFCLDSLDIDLQGEVTSGVSKGFRILVEQCSGKVSCKTQEEIDDFIDNNGQFIIFTNELTYLTNVYDEQTISKELLNRIMPLNRFTRTT